MNRKRNIQRPTSNVQHSTRIGFDEWKVALAKAEADTVDEVPKGWITMEQFAVIIGRSAPRAFVRMQRLLKAGAAEPQKFRIACPAGPRLIAHYRLKK